MRKILLLCLYGLFGLTATCFIGFILLAMYLSNVEEPPDFDNILKRSGLSLLQHAKVIRWENHVGGFLLNDQLIRVEFELGKDDSKFASACNLLGYQRGFKTGENPIPNAVHQPTNPESVCWKSTSDRKEVFVIFDNILVYRFVN